MAKIIDTADFTPSNPDETSWMYNGLDSAITAEVYEKLIPQLNSRTEATYSLSRRLQAPILEMNLTGIQVDFAAHHQEQTAASTLKERLEAQLRRILTEAWDEPDLNWRSDTQLKNLFYTKMRLPEKRKRNSNGAFTPTVDRDALEKLRQHMLARPIIDHILLLRDIDKKLSFINTSISIDGRLRTGFNIAGTSTGRLSSAHDNFGEGRNLQNVDRALRRMFVASKGKRLCNIDLEQADSRNIGATCWNAFVETFGEAFAGAYLDACESGDLHTNVTRMIWPELPWGTSPERAIADQIFYRDFSYRDMSKRGGHGTNYVATPPTMATHLHITRAIAEEFQRKYFGAFPEIKELHKWVANELAASSIMVTIWGRQRTFFDRPNEAKTIRDAVAYLGQSATADEINYGLLRLHQDAVRFPGLRLLIQVHDSILFEYPEEMEDEVVPWAIERLTVSRELKRGRPFAVPCEAKVGWNWGDRDKEGKRNPDGLVKWTGQTDRRTRQTIPSYTRLG